tara:strand:- start:317 stop:952 length:636 start_codon:yes stop_codon:yes gene_type:complete
MSDNFELPYNKVKLRSYWNNYYSTNNKVLPHSDFSSFVSENLNTNSTLIDIGCGDGRDSIYFSDKKIITTGVDISEKVINKNKEYENEYLNFEVLDLENINSITKKFDFAYCRFLFHAISEDIENQLLEWFGENINSRIFIETRIKDTKQIVITENHYRRYFEEQYFVNKVQKAGFKVLFNQTSRSFSQYKKIYNVKDVNHDPLLLRMIIA